MGWPLQFIIVAGPIFPLQVETNISHIVMAKGGSTIWILHCYGEIPGM